MHPTGYLTLRTRYHLGRPLPRRWVACCAGLVLTVEWPVTLLVMAGTYVADRARPTAEADSVVDASPSSAAESSDSPPDSAALPR